MGKLEMSNVIQLNPRPAAEPKCSFCNTPKSKTQSMVASGTGAYICGACIAKAKERIKHG